MSRNLLLGLVALAALHPSPGSAAGDGQVVAPGVAEAQAFIDEAEAQLAQARELWNRTLWVKQNFITFDTDLLAANATENYNNLIVGLLGRAKAYDGMDLPGELARKLELLKRQIDVPPPDDPAKSAELARLTTELDSMYGQGEYCQDGKCRDLEELSELMRSSRNEAALLDAWTGWHSIAPPMKDKYVRMVTIANEGARDLGFADVGSFWQSRYDMPPADFVAETDRLWNEVKPLYQALHCHVRAKLGEAYGTDVVPPAGPIPAHLLGNMWAQEWGNIYDLVAPEDADQGYDLTEILEARKFDAEGIVRTAEGFFTSLGFSPLPETFWQRSLLTKPEDREVVCHASAWDLDDQEDLRIKMCVRINEEDFRTAHHELGHNFYFRAYKDQPLLFRDGANDGFHEAIGDTIALSITPEYLVRIGLLDQAPDASRDTGLLLRQALDGVAFLPFGLLVDRWRWQVFSGEAGPTEYNATWWQLREDYQGIKAPVARPPDAFDPGAKYHIPGNVPYMRYFLARILQYQFHQAACAQAGFEGPLHRCSIYDDKEVGQGLQAMLAMGASRPWPEVLQAFTGTDRLDATALLAYFAPLKTWLDEQNRDRQCGW
ncbi:M2 family metallopeptidase [Geminicoccus harenae]|uniref:M2 family metallopeptidase n=1 Tax=Geminicoccus harenae TaxID=2498453 RepID=UPI00168BCB6A|nr:M2 family metallopeptidase [Geminicoccus harenae]